MEEKNEKRAPELGDLEEKPSEELTEDATAEISGGMFPKAGKSGGGSAKQYVYKIPAPPAPYAPVPFPVGA